MFYRYSRVPEQVLIGQALRHLCGICPLHYAPRPPGPSQLPLDKCVWQTPIPVGPGASLYLGKHTYSFRKLLPLSPLAVPKPRGPCIRDVSAQLSSAGTSRKGWATMLMAPPTLRGPNRGGCTLDISP